MPIRQLPPAAASAVSAGALTASVSAIASGLVYNALDAAASAVSLVISLDADAIVIEVTDNGDGIHAEDFPLVGVSGATSRSGPSPPPPSPLWARR